MSIIINMKMPEHCGKCCLLGIERRNNYYWCKAAKREVDRDLFKQNKREWFCPIEDEISHPHGALIEKDDVDISLPSFGTDEWVREIVEKNGFTFLNDIDEDAAFDFGMDFVNGFMNIVDTAEVVVKGDNY